MSSPPSAQPVGLPTAIDTREVRVYSHSSLFYWWPVWAVGFLMALLTLLDGHRLAVVPAGTIAKGNEILLPDGQTLPKDQEGNPWQPRLHIAQSKNYGVFFATVLLLIILISNVPMHGLWSVLVILGIVLIVLVLILAGWWDWLADKWDLLDVRINMGGYLFLSTALFIIWVVTVCIFDHRRYVAVSAGQVRVCQAIGMGEQAIDATNLTFEKRQDDLFRHWVVGLGSGDLLIHKPGIKDIELPNVLFVGAKVRQMEELIRAKEVV
jgi:hypothetical protein